MPVFVAIIMEAGYVCQNEIRFIRDFTHLAQISNLIRMIMWCRTLGASTRVKLGIRLLLLVSHYQAKLFTYMRTSPVLHGVAAPNSDYPVPGEDTIL